MQKGWRLIAQDGFWVVRYDPYIKVYMQDTFTLYFSKDDTKILIGDFLLNDEMRNLIIQEVEERNYSSFTKLQDGEVVLNVEVFGRLGLEKVIL